MNDEQLDSAPAESIEDFISEAFDSFDSDNPVADTEPEIGASDAVVEAHTDAEPEMDTSDNEDVAEDRDGPADQQTTTAPQSMSAKDRESFYALPPDQQSWLSDRVKQQEGDYTKKTMELSEQRKVYDKLEQVIAPRRQALAVNGMDDSTAIGQLFALSDFATENPVGFTQYLFQQRGIPLSALTESGAGNTAAADPQLTAMQREIHGLKDHFARQVEEQRTQQRDSVSGDIQSFRADHPFYSDLEPEMIPLVGGFQESQPGLSNQEYLSLAYRAALAVNDEVRARASADDNAARITATKKAAAKAKRATGTNLRSKASLPQAATQAKNVDDFIGALVDERMTA
tara:strand:+ start:835 stop:1866 length:1032 start_codon:yes stop_codon:yes gene_type:complete